MWNLSVDLNHEFSPVFSAMHCLWCDMYDNVNTGRRNKSFTFWGVTKYMEKGIDLVTYNLSISHHFSLLFPSLSCLAVASCTPNHCVFKILTLLFFNSSFNSILDIISPLWLGWLSLFGYWGASAADVQCSLCSGFGLLQAILPVDARALAVARLEGFFASRKTPWGTEFF